MKQPHDISKKVFMTKGKFMLRFIGYHHKYEGINVSKRNWYRSENLTEFGKGEANHPSAR